jgi:hypothetical protein
VLDRIARLVGETAKRIMSEDDLAARGERRVCSMCEGDGVFFLRLRPGCND